MGESTSGSRSVVSDEDPKKSIGLLDLLTRDRYVPVGAALRRSVERARVADELGFDSYWFGEHHVARAASVSPQSLIAAVGASTKRIILGAGGILLRYQNPLKVASDFNTLAHLFSGRINLGIAAGSVAPRRAERLASYPPGSDFAERVSALIGAFESDDPDAAAIPRAPARGDPAIWMLSSGGGTADIAAEKGLPVLFALFLTNVEQVRKGIDRYVSGFVSALPGQQPKWGIAVAVGTGDMSDSYSPQAVRVSACGEATFCAETAYELASSLAASVLLLLDVTPQDQVMSRTSAFAQTLLS